MEQAWAQSRSRRPAVPKSRFTNAGKVSNEKQLSGGNVHEVGACRPGYPCLIEVAFKSERDFRSRHNPFGILTAV